MLLSVMIYDFEGGGDMSEEDLIIIEHLAPYLANTLRNENPDSTAYKAAMKTVESPEFQARMDVLRTHEYTVTAQGIVITDTPTNNEPTNWGAVIGILLGSIALFFVIVILILGLLVKSITKKKRGTKLICTCTKCNNTREELYENVINGFSSLFTKQRSIHKGAMVGGVGVSTTHYSMYQKKIFCPICRKKTWHEIRNVNDVMYQNYPAAEKVRDVMFDNQVNRDR